MEKTPSGERPADGPEVVPCGSCGSTAPPDEQGLCPGISGNKCRRTRVGSKLAVVHDGRSKLSPADLAARDALLDRLLAERGGRGNLDIVSQLRCEDFATAQIQLGKVTRRLETLGAVSTAGNKRSSLVDTYAVFSARVERLAAELPPPRAPSYTPDDAANLTTEGLIERTTKILRELLALRDAESAPPPDTTTYLAKAIDSIEEQDAPRAPTTPPEPTCSYGCGSRCAEFKATRLDIWRVLHGLDPDEVARRHAELNKEFRLSVGIDRPPLGERRDPFANLSPEERARELAAQRVRRELGWERDDGLGTRRE